LAFVYNTTQSINYREFCFISNNTKKRRSNGVR